MKNTGITWIPEVGDEWETYKVAHGFSAVGSGTTPDTENPAYYDGDVPWVTTSELRETVISDTTKKVTRRALHDHSALKLFPEGTLLIAMYGATIGRLGVLGIPACMNQACCALGAGTFLDARFVYYWLLGFREHVIQLASGGGQPNISQEKIRSLRIPAPSQDVQVRIASFLDRKTAAIDALIARKERLIELLQEKRQALITQAVTKGLDPNVPMKESGVPAIGRIPAHWTVKRLKRISPSQTVGVVVNPSSYYADDGVPFLSGKNVREGTFLLDDVRRISAESNRLLRKSMLRAGDLVTVRVGYPGVTAVVPTELDGCNCASMMIVRQARSFCSEWLCLAMNSLVGRQQVEIVQYGAAQEQFNISHAVEFAFPVPPLAEQEAIAQMVGANTRRLDAAVAAIESHNEKLREYRQALITAAVTGKIDVSKEAA
ncbi:MAG: restriction endonuclease subunit S [Polyangiaceae bacterium]